MSHVEVAQSVLGKLLGLGYQSGCFKASLHWSCSHVPCSTEMLFRYSPGARDDGHHIVPACSCSMRMCGS